MPHARIGGSGRDSGSSQRQGHQTATATAGPKNPEAKMGFGLGEHDTLKTCHPEDGSEPTEGSGWGARIIQSHGRFTGGTEKRN